MDISSNNSYPATALSNFAPHEFEIDGIKCASMEGFLQSLKFKDVEIQKYVCTLIGKKAKFKGKKKKWYTNQTLFWQGQPIKRNSEEYQNLLKRAYLSMCKNDSFKKAIIASGNATFTHSIGKNKITETVLTEREFVSLLNMCRKHILGAHVPRGRDCPANKL